MKRIQTLPLFPLNTVLFPGMPLHLQVFEERYELLVRRCLDDQLPFGVNLIKSGSEVGEPAEPHLIGTTARIAACKELSEGRFRIVAIGVRRYRLLDYTYHAEPYMIGFGEELRDARGNDRETHRVMESLSDHFRSYFESLAKRAGIPVPKYDLPSEPEEFSMVMAAILQTESAEKQELLEMTDTAARLRREAEILMRGAAGAKETGMIRRTIIARSIQTESRKDYFRPN